MTPMAVNAILLAVIVLFDYMPIIRQRKIRDIISYALLLAAGFTIIVLHELGVEVPSPPMLMNDAIRKMIGYPD